MDDNFREIIFGALVWRSGLMSGLIWPKFFVSLLLSVGFGQGAGIGVGTDNVIRSNRSKLAIASLTNYSGPFQSFNHFATFKTLSD